jgi:hypothetical protein
LVVEGAEIMDLSIVIGIMTFILAIVVDWEKVKTFIFGSDPSPRRIEIISIGVATIGIFIYPSLIDKYFVASFFHNPGDLRTFLMIGGTIPLIIGTRYIVRAILSKVVGLG